ncbi:hypothetical protein [uncultured Arcticibacterium sp.]|uniref:hypothetical protein n=1 Tax=uncultured Arcticibacterium sp. TaxID=2173042 RepID=UPI0030F78075
MKKIIITSLSAFVLIACQSGSDSETLSEKIEEQVKAKGEVCDYLKDEDVKEVYGLSDSHEIRRNENYGICNLNWKKDPSSDDASVYYSVSMNFSTLEATTKEEAKEGFDMIISRMTGGMKISNESIQEKAKEMGVDMDLSETLKDGVTIQGQSFTEIAGVGDKAMWSARTTQLTILKGTEVFFVNTHCGGDKVEALEKAKAMAIKVAAML